MQVSEEPRTVEPGRGAIGPGDRAVDVIVAGAGPAGSTAAYVAASRGLRTLLVEKRGPPRDKTCGGLLTHLCVDHIRAIYRTDVPREVQVPPSPMSVFVAPPSGRARGFVVPGEYVLSVTRRAFDGWLTERAADQGAEVFRDSEVLRYRVERDRVRVSVRTSDGPVDIVARCLIGADGVYSSVREQLQPRPLANRAYYIQEYYPRFGDFEDWFYLMYRGDTSSIYAYVIPKRDLLCLGIGVHKSVPPTYEAGMARFKAWLVDEFRFRDQGVQDREGYSVPFGNVLLGAGNVLLAGDAAGFCYPPTGEGITFAIQSGAAAANALLDGPPDVLGRYAAEMATVRGSIEAAAARILYMTDAQRDERILSKAGL